MVDTSSTLISSDHKLYKHFTQFTESYLIGRQNFCFPKYGPEILKKFQTFKANDDDVCVVTFPKTGTTWLQAIVYLLSIDVDFEKARTFKLDTDFPYVGHSVWENRAINSCEVAANAPSPRLLKFHTPYSLLPLDILEKKCKVLYMCRNIKDTITSYYHFSKAVTTCRFEGTIDDFAKLFMLNNVPFAPYISHVKEVWEKRHENHIYFTTYEKMKKDQEKVIGEIARFLNKSVTEDEIKMVANYCKFENMKSNKTLNREHWEATGSLCNDNYKFMRKGVIGSWKCDMTNELITEIDKWVIENTSDCPDLRKFL